MLIAAAAILFVGCSKENSIDAEGVKMVDIVLNVDAQNGKAVLIDTPVAGEKVLAWTAGDKITVVTDNGAGAAGAKCQAFTLNYIGADSTSTGSFEGQIPAGAQPLYAIYPATENFSVTKRTVNSAACYLVGDYEIPTIQYAVKGGIKGEYNISSGVITTEGSKYSVALTSCCSIIKVVLPSDLTNIKAITLKTALGQPASGKVGLVQDDINALSATTYVPEVTLCNEDNSELVPGEYFISVIPSLPNYIQALDSEINYGFSRITFTRSDSTFFTKKFSEEYLALENNNIYALKFTEGMSLPLRTRKTVTCTLQAMADALNAGNYKTEATKSSEDVVVMVDTFKFVLKSFVPKTGYTNGWFTEVKDGTLRVQNSNLQGSSKKGGYAYIQIPVTYGKHKLTNVVFNTHANNGNFGLSNLFPYDKSQASPFGKTPGCSTINLGDSAYSVFWTAHSDATELWLASYSGGRNVFDGDITCTYELKYNEPKTTSSIAVEKLGSLSEYKF